MTYQDVGDLVSGFGLPCAYYQFRDNTATAPPFVCWFFEDDEDFGADDVNYAKIRPVRIELYTDYKDFDLEQRIENSITAADLRFSRSEGAIPSERMYMVAFTVPILITTEE